MNEVASRVSSKWKEISIQLGLTLNDQKYFMELTSGDPLQCFTFVFTVWKSRATRPYKWSTMIEALESPGVDEMRLAQELRKKLQSEWDSGEQSKLQFSLGVDVLPLRYNVSLISSLLHPQLANIEVRGWNKASKMSSVPSKLNFQVHY